MILKFKGWNVFTRVQHRVPQRFMKKMSNSKIQLNLNKNPVNMSFKYLSSAEAKAFDEELMSPEEGFTLDQLVELAGLSCASAVEYGYPCEAYPRVLVLAGPGNNGNDGIVCARHLKHFGYDVKVHIPKRKDQTFVNNIIRQCEHLDIPFIDLPKSYEDQYDLLVDALFGFSFSGPLRSPFDTIIQSMISTTVPIVSIDIPSGWNVDEGDVNSNGLKPDALISLTAPKKCAATFKGRYHFLGGRFVPKTLALKYGIQLNQYKKSQQFAVLKE